MKPHAIHPAAAVWPMLPDDELQALADDIAAHGLRYPIIVDRDDQILDGRNRLAACELACIEPEYAVLHDGQDPVAFVLSANALRRHMTKGQRAMAAWKTATLSQSESTTTAVATESNASLTQVGMAKVVHDHTPDFVTVVIAGAMPLKLAYEEARRRRTDADGVEARMAKLPEDLAAQVREESLTLTEAEAASRARDKRRSDERRDARSLLTRIVDLAAPVDMSTTFVDTWVRQLDYVEPELLDRLDGAIDTLFNLRKAFT